MPELAVTPSCERGLGHLREVRTLNFDAVAVGIHFKQDVTAPKDEQVRVLTDDAVNNATLLKKGQLCIRLVRRN